MGTSGYNGKIVHSKIHDILWHCGYLCMIYYTNNCIVNHCYDDMVSNITNRNTKCKNWANNIKNELYSIGMGEYWEAQSHINVDHFISEVKMRLIDIFLQECYMFMDNSSKCLLYKNLVDTFCLQYYLKKNMCKKYRTIVTKYRLSSHKLAIERGRFTNIPTYDRKCTLCNHNDLEDEYHFILICPMFIDQRLKYINVSNVTNITHRRSSVFVSRLWTL